MLSGDKQGRWGSAMGVHLGSPCRPEYLPLECLPGLICRAGGAPCQAHRRWWVSTPAETDVAAGGRRWPLGHELSSLGRWGRGRTLGIRNHVHSFPRVLQWSPLRGDVTGWHRHRHHAGPHGACDTTNEAWERLSGALWVRRCARPACPVRGHEKVPTGGQVWVPGFGHVCPGQDAVVLLTAVNGRKFVRHGWAAAPVKARVP